jgi:hypothetical protein
MVGQDELPAVGVEMDLRVLGADQPFKIGRVEADARRSAYGQTVAEVDGAWAFARRPRANILALAAQAELLRSPTRDTELKAGGE